jgi:hypothetical protein
MRLIKSIVIDIIPHARQRYETVGDYFFTDGILHIRVSGMKDNKFELLVAIHELIEVMLTENDGVAEPDIAAFDKRFEEARVEGNLDEPGDDSGAPYKKQHCIATAVERMMCALLNVDWKEYERTVNEL